MGFLESLDYDFRDILIIDKKKFNRPLIPGVLWGALASAPLVLWKFILIKYRIRFEYETTIDPVHSCLGEYDEDDCYAVMKALISNNDTQRNLIFQVIQTVMHEYIHASQSFCNSDQFNNVIDDDTFVSYLSQWREVQALAHCTFLEIMEYNDRPTRTMEYYSETTTETRRDFYKWVHKWSRKHDVFLLLKK